jgi:iron complex outermembrane receptor protein
MKHVALRVALFTSVPFQLMAAVPALAQSSDSVVSDGTIIVNARRIEERLQDVPISISVVDQDRITKSNISSSEDLARVVPGLSVDSRYSSEQSSFSIRGFSQQLRTSAAVGTYFGEVVAPRGSALSLQGGDGAGPGYMFDLQNVQVLKGPQGTLFGRNTTGGAVLLVPRKPTDRFEGYLEGSYGNYDALRIQAVANVPLADFARLRLGVDRMVRDGYVKNLSNNGPKRFNNTDYTALRGSLVLDLSPDIENYTIVTYVKSENAGTIPQIIRGNPNVRGFGTEAVLQVARRLASGERWSVEQTLTNPIVRSKMFQAINNTTWTVTDNLTIKNIASYSRFIQDLRQNIFGTNFAAGPGFYITGAYSFAPDGAHGSDQKNFTEELQFQLNGMDGKLNFQTGLYYEHSTPGSLSAGGAPSTGAICRYGEFTRFDNAYCVRGTTTPNSGSIEYINMAAYAQGTYALTDQLKATAGIRYTYDRAKGYGRGLQGTYSVNAQGQSIVTFQGAGCAAGYPAPTCEFRGRTSDKKPTWTLNLAYNPIENAMIYATYSRGYKQGGVTPFSPGGVPFFGPEKVDNYEVGLKTSFDGSVSGNFNVAGFYSKLRDQQVLIGLQDPSGALASGTSVLNAGKSRMYGVDADAMVRFGKMFRVFGSGTYLNTKLVELADPGFPQYAVKLFPPAGGPLELSPKWSTNVGATFTLPTSDEVGQIELGGTYRYTSAFLTGGAGGASTPVKQLDLNFDWRNVGGTPIDFSIYATNVTNQLTYTYVLPLFNSFGFDPGYLGQPRMYGARIKIRFGEGN